MQLAYLILCHSNPNHIARLTKKLSSENSHIFIHVDKKVSIEPFVAALKSCSNYTLLQDRIAVYWGGYSAINATIALMKAALETGNFDRFILLQGLEYPIKSKDEINHFFAENLDREFICAQNISIRKDARSIHKYRLYHFLDAPGTLRWKIANKLRAYCLKHDRIIHLKPNKIKNIDNQIMEIYQGAAQIALTRNAVEYIVNFNKRNHRVNRFFKTTFAVDETYFHTILYNSKFRDNMPAPIVKDFPRLADFINLTYFEYPGDSIEICIFKNVDDYERLQKSGCLFFRKATEDSNKLLDRIDNLHNTR